MVEGFDTLNKLTFFPQRIYPVRSQMLWWLRKYYALRHSLPLPRANREGAAR